MKKKMLCMLWMVLIIMLASCDNATMPPRIDTDEINTQTEEPKNTNQPIKPVIKGDETSTPVTGDYLDKQFADKKIQILPDSEIEWTGYHDIWQDSSKTIFNGVLRFLIDDNTFYFTNNKNGFDKYSPESDIRVPVCTDPGCTHSDNNCISVDYPKKDDTTSSSTVKLFFSDNDSLYFSVDSVLYRYVNSRSKLEQIADFSLMGESIYVSGQFVCKEYKDKIYVQLLVLKEGGDPSVREDYGLAIYSMNKNGTSKKELINFGNYSTQLLSVDNDTIYYIRDDWTIVTTDLNGKNEKELFEIKWLKDPYVTESGIIYSVITETWQDTNTFKACNIYRYDFATATHTLICDERVREYKVTEKYVYYLPRPDGRNYHSLCRMNHDGTDKTEVQKIIFIEESAIISFWSVIGDYMIVVNNQGKAYCVDLVEGTYSRISSLESRWYKMNYIE